MGSLGLLVFASIVWQFEPRHSAWIVLLVRHCSVADGFRFDRGSSNR